MEKLEIGQKIRKEGVTFTILDRSETIYLAHLDSGAYEVGKIKKQRGSVVNKGGRLIEFKEKETINTAEGFGKNGVDKCFNISRKDVAFSYFKEITKERFKV